MILYGILTQEHIGKLLMAGLVPGILLSLLFILTIVVAVMIKPELAPTGESYSWKERFQSLSSVAPIALLFLVVIGGMYIGLYGPTEAAGAGAFFAIVITVFQRKFNWSSLTKVLGRTLSTIGFIFGIMISALLLNSVLVHAKTTLMLSAWITNLRIEPITIFIAIVILFIILGAFMDAMAAMVIMIPILLPIVEMVGFDLIWFGVIMCLLVEVGMISPPVGMNVIVLHGTVPKLDLISIYKGSFLFMIPLILIIILLYIFPEIALFVPNRM
jgi:tripartite ATP-independent transporter DctM subunit